MGPVCNLYRSGQEVNQVVLDVLGKNAGAVFSGSGHCMELQFSQMTSIAPFFRIWYMDQHYLNINQTMTLPLRGSSTMRKATFFFKNETRLILNIHIVQLLIHYNIFSYE